jgi:hypothetical protein
MLKEAHRFMVFETRVLKKIFGSGRVEVMSLKENVQ